MIFETILNYFVAQGVQAFLPTIKLDEHYQIDFKMSMTKLEPKDMSFS